MTVLLLAEQKSGTLNDVTARALTAALAIGEEIHVLVAGQGAAEAAKAAAQLEGVGKVHVAEGGVLDHDLAEPLAALLVRLAEHHKTIMAPATASTKNVMPRAAALLDVMQISEIIKVVAPDTFERPIYAGNAIQTVRTADPVKVITVRTAAFAGGPDGHLLGFDRDARRCRRRPGLVALRRRGAGTVRSAGTDLGQDHHFGRPRHG